MGKNIKTVKIFSKGRWGNNVLQELYAINLVAQFGDQGTKIFKDSSVCTSYPIVEKKKLLKSYFRTTKLNKTYMAGQPIKIMPKIEVHSVPLWADSFPSPKVCRSLLNVEGSNTDIPSDYIVINVRADEILAGVHKDYLPVPIEYYRYILNLHGLRPIFMGQIDSSEYVRLLRATFPSADFLESKGLWGDFRFIQNAPNIFIATSTFSWLASYVSDAKKIFVPKIGLLDRSVRPDVNLLPTDDPRYEIVEL